MPQVRLRGVCCPTDGLNALHDQIEPAASDDTQIPRFTWWDHRVAQPLVGEGLTNAE